jgi:4-amino-4-deoxy-L-arabinose transferase-like glycosyltransferase
MDASKSATLASLPATPLREKATNRISAIIKSLNSPSTVTHRAVFFGLVLVAIIFRVVCFQGYLDSDPRAYTELANRLSHGVLQIPAYFGAPVYPLRLGVYVPVAALVRVFGLSEVTVAAYPFLISILGCLLTYALARYLAMPIAGIIALALLAFTPLDIASASLLWGDAIAAFWANVAVAVALIAFNRASIVQVSSFGLLGGVLFGISWLCRESVVYLVPFVLLLALFGECTTTKAGRMAGLATIGIGAAAVLVAEMICYHKLTGDPLFRPHAIERNYHYGIGVVGFFDSSSPTHGWKSGGYTKALLLRLFYSGPRALILNTEMLLLPAAALLSAAWALRTRQHKLFLPILWLVSLMLTFNFMSTSFAAYKPLPLDLPRYMYPLLLPSLILVGGFLAGLLTSATDKAKSHRERLFAALIMAICFLGLSGVVAGRRRLMSRPEQIERRVAARLAKDDIVYTDYRSAASLVYFRTGALLPANFFFRTESTVFHLGQGNDKALLPANSKTIPWESIRQEQIPSGAYVLVDKTKVNFMAKNYKYEPPSFVSHPPPSWKIVWNSTEDELYLASGR